MGKISFGWRVTDEEYRANINGMNTFFGAVLGFVLADVTTSDMLGFAQLLMFTAAIVIGILYVSASAQRWAYAAFNLLLIWGLPRALREEPAELGRLQVTLAVWTGLTIFLELIKMFSVRPDEPEKPPTSP